VTDRQAPLAAVILAAGQGTRMKSALHKVLHPIAGKPMLLHVLDALAPLAPSAEVVVVGARADQVQAAVHDRAISLAHQAEQLGTGHAVQQLLEPLAGFDCDLLVLNGDVPLLRGEEEIERPADQRTITRRYTEESVKKINELKDGPFFLYLAHSLPHIPLFRAPEFKDRSAAGIYGDVIEEIDWSVGEIVAALKEASVEKRTLVIFTSDNGPWLTFDTHGGTAGLLRDGKGSTWEGGQRVPTVMSWPGKLAPGVVSDMGSTLDLLPTFVSLAGGSAPEDRTMDGHDLSPALFGTGPSPRETMFFYQGAQLFAVRKGPFKIHFTTYTSYVKQKPVPQNPPLLYHLDHDPSERFNIAAKHSEIVAELKSLAEAHRKSIEPVEDQLAKRIGDGQ
jgi:molybdopterin-guanine dinucleotide biosynthesis protein A